MYAICTLYSQSPESSMLISRYSWHDSRKAFTKLDFNILEEDLGIIPALGCWLSIAV